MKAYMTRAEKEALRTVRAHIVMALARANPSESPQALSHMRWAQAALEAVIYTPPVTKPTRRKLQ